MKKISSFYRITRSKFTLRTTLVLAFLLMGGVALAHNLQTKMVYMFFDPNTQACLDARLDGTALPPGCAPLPGGWVPGDPLLQQNDELGLIIKVVPRDGTTTGVGGHVDFYVPSGVTVIDAAYILPGDSNPADGISGYDKVSMKGQSLIAVGAGPIGAKATSQLIGLGPVGPNVNGMTEDPVVVATGLHRGTVAGVYGDTGIFYSTDPDTAYGSWQRFTGDAGANDIPLCGVVGNPLVPLTAGKTITNNSGDVFIPCNKWDAEQMYAWGVKGTTYAGSGFSLNPIVDYGDGRGNAPWGFASGVAGPQSGYAWHFDWDEWRLSAKTAADMRAAMSNDSIGPWKRIKYPGSRVSFDQPGLDSTIIGLASQDASKLGIAPNALPATVSQTDTTSPKTIRWAVGQLTINVPEYVWVKVRVNDPSGIPSTDGCPRFHGDTFGGDAGGDNNGKDHLWRYYEPSRTTVNACVMPGKPTSSVGAAVGQTVQYNVKTYNLGTTALTNVVIKDTLPSGVSFVSAFPAQNSGPNPLVWNVGTVLPGEGFESLVSVKVTGSGLIENVMCVTSDQYPNPECTAEVISNNPLLKQTKTVSTSTVAPGANVQYTLTIENIGSAASGNPTTIYEYLENDVTYVSKDSVTVNGASYTASTTVNSADPQNPVFTVPAGINAGQKLVLKFTANVSATAAAGTYCNSFTSWQNGLPLTTGSQACFSVGGAKIGDTIFRDWNGNGAQDAVDEGVAGVSVTLLKDADNNGSYETTVATTTTNAGGNYLFEGLTAGQYQVVVTTATGPLAGFTNTADPDGSTASQANLTLTDGEQNLQQDFGYKPAGTGQIGDLVWWDMNGDGDPTGESGIANVTVRLYEDSNGNGIVDPDDALVGTQVTNGSGIYNFTGLALDWNYIVAVDQGDPDIATGGTGTGVISSSTPLTYAVELTSGAEGVASFQDADFGFYRQAPATISGNVFQDSGNGVYDGEPTDTDLPSVDVILYQDLNNNGVVDSGEPQVETLSTNGSGYYQFTDVPPGNYVVVVNSQDQNVPDGLSAAIQSLEADVASGQDLTGIDFPFTQLLTKAVYNVTAGGVNTGANAATNDILEYTLTPNYTGGQLLTDLTISDVIPEGTTYAGNDEPAASSEPSIGGTGTVSWNIGSNTPDVPGVQVLCPITANIVTNKDTYVNNEHDLRNYGSNATNGYISTRNDSGKERAGLVQFDLSGIAAGSIIQSATLKMTPQGGAGTNRQAEVRPMLTSWTEGDEYDSNCAGTGANWHVPDCASATTWSAGDFSTADFGASVGQLDPTSNNVTRSLAVTTTVQNWFATPSSNKGFALWPVGSNGTAVTWYNQASTTTAYRPTLEVKYLEPSATGTCAVQTDGMVVYDNNNVTPVYKNFTGATNTFGTGTNASALSNKLKVMAMASSPTIDERIFVGVTDNASNNVVGEIYSAGAWANIPNPPAKDANGTLGQASVTNSYSAAVAYEQQSGRAVVVWDDNTQAVDKLRFSIWDGTTWTAAASITAYTGGEPIYMRLAAQPGGNGMVLVVNDAVFDSYALVWDGSAWGNQQALDTGAVANNLEALNVAYEGATGRALVTYGKDATRNVFYRTWNGTSWSAEASVAPPAGIDANAGKATPQWLVMASDASSNRIVMGALTQDKDVWFGIWTGSGWSSLVAATTGSQTSAEMNLAVAFESISGQALAVYAESKNVRYRTWGASGWSGELTGPVLSNNAITLTLNSDPNSDKVMLSALDSGKDVYNALWTGSAWNAYVKQSTDSGYAVGQPFAYNWRRDQVAKTATKTIIAVTPTVFTSSTTATVTITIDSAYTGTITGVPLSSSVTGGVSVGSCTGPSPSVSQAITAGTPLVFTYSCPISASGNYGSATFTSLPTGTGQGVQFRTGTSNSVLGTPPLKYRVTVTGDVSPILNTGTIYTNEAEQLTPNMCYAIADSTDRASTTNDIDALFSWNLTDAGATAIGTVTGTTHSEAAAWNSEYTAIYTTNRDATVNDGSDRFGTVNPTTGVFTAYSAVQGGACAGRVACDTANANTDLEGSLGSFTILDIDGMSFDPATGQLYAVHRRESGALLDVLLKINPVTGQHVEDAFGAGVDYVVLNTNTLTPTALYDIDDIAFHPATGVLYGIANSTATVSGLSDRLVTINKTTGAVTGVGATTTIPSSTGGVVEDLEGLSFVDAPSGIVLYASTGTGGAPATNNSLFSINLTTAVATKIAEAPGILGDVEAIACQVGEFTGDPIIPPSDSNEVRTDLPTGSIGDFVWWDYFPDGIYDADGVDDIPGNADDEAPLAGAFVFVYEDSNNNGVFDKGVDVQVGFDITDASGIYTVDGLPGGTYFVDVYEDSITTDGNRDIVPTTGNVLKRVMTCGVSCNSFTDADFGYYVGALVEGTVFWDVNHDGTQAASGEPGLAGILVTLTGTDVLGNPVNLTTPTDANGYYDFIVPPGDYTVSYNTAQTTGAGLPEATTLTSFFFTAEAGEDHQYVYDFGVDNAGAIGNFIWNDANPANIGTWTAGELGMAGVTVVLYLDMDGNPATTGDQTYLETTLTDGSGHYEFIGLADTTASQAYVVKVVTSTLPAGFTATGEGDPGTACGGSCDSQIATTLTGGATINTVDFGYRNTASFTVSGLVWDDNGTGGGTAGDGIRNGTEPGIDDVTVSLVTKGIIDGYVDVNGDGVITSADDGFYGGFTVTDGVLLGANGQSIYGVLVIGGRLDVDGNGVLSASDDLDPVLFASTTTAAGGAYSFLGVPNGDYLIKTDSSTLPSTAYVQTGDPDALKDDQTGIRVNGASVIDQNFGYQTSYGTISGTIVTGADGDGLAEVGETPVPGVTVFLTWAGPDGILGNADDVVVTTTTDGAGDYAFNATTITSGPLDFGLLPGIYQITKTNPAGLISLADADGGNASSISVNLTVGQTKTDQDFELQGSPGGIGDTVWLDTDRDGVFDIGEPGLANVNVELAKAYPVTDGYVDVNGATAGYGDGWLRGIEVIAGALDMNGNGVIDAGDDGAFFGTAVIDGRLDLNGGGVSATDDGYTGGDTLATEVTDMQGNYLFTSVPPGDYLVLVNESTLPGAPGSLTETAGTSNASGLVTVTAGATNLDVDFGYVGDPTRAIIGNFVWSDADNDGEQDPGEPGIGGVTLRLLDEFGAPVDNPNLGGTQDFIVTTSTDGSYYFFGVLPGKYKVEVTDTGGVLSGYSLTVGSQSSTDPSAAITVGAGTIYDKADFGYYNPNLFSITDRTWYDANRNGMVDPGETGIGGVTVDLVFDENGDGIVDYEVIGGRIDLNNDGKIDASDDTGAGETLGGYRIIDGFVDFDNDGSITTADDGTYNGYPVIDGVLDLNASGTVPPNKASIGDLVWLDSDGDGLKDANEAGLSGVTVRLCSDASCTTVLATTTTDAQGGYLFDGLDTGTYYVNVSSGLPTNLTYTTFNGTTGAIALVAGQTYTTADFGYKPTGTTAVIGDRVWSDNDGDGTQDAGEAGIGNVTVTLNSIRVINGYLDLNNDNAITTADDGSFGGYTVTDGVISAPNGTYLPVYTSGGVNSVQVISGGLDINGGGAIDGGDDVAPAVVATTTTDPDGSYLFTNVTASTYAVAVTAPGGYTQTYDLDGITTLNRAVATVTAGGANLSADFGYQITTPANRGVIGNTVFDDLNGNGVQDAGETGIAGVTLNLYTDPNKDGNPADGVLVGTLTTDTNGNYSFSGLPVSAGGTGYVVEVTDTKGLLANAYQSADPDENNTCLVCNYRGSATLYPTGTSTGSTDNSLDFGFYTQDNGTISPEPVIASTLSEPDGSFSFDGLENGDYVVSISDNAGELANLQGTTAESQAGESGVTVNGADIQGENFGYAGLGPIGDRIWSDADGDGLQDPNELGIGGVTVKLYFDSNNNGVFDSGTDALLKTATTDSLGNYEFNDLPAGTFFVQANNGSTLTNYTQTGDLEGCTGTWPSVTCTTPNVAKVTLTSNEPSFLDADFGYRSDINLADVSGTVWNDPNRNAVLETGEPRFTGVTVVLLNNSGQVVATTTTDANGNYSFPDVPVGSYKVVVTDDDDVLNGFFITSGLDETPVTVGATDITNVNFGYARQTGTASIGDTVWLDANNDGAFQANESGLSGVVVNLYRPGVGPDGIPGNADDAFLVGTTVTDAGGSYLFSGLSAGNYVVDVISGVPANLVPGFGTTDPTGTINLSDGEDYLDADFGYVPASGFAVLGDTVWYDVNGNGLQDASEVGIGGVAVKIVNSATQAVIAIVTTNPDGSWLAVIPEDGTPTDYVIVVDNTTLPGGLITTPTNMNGGDTYIASVKAGDVKLNLDFGYEGGVGGVIGDQVFLDANGDNMWTAGEGLGGVTLSLYSIGIIDGYVDINGDGVISAADDGSYGGKNVIDGAIDFNGIGGITPDDDGVLNGIAVIDGRLDVNRDGVIGANDVLPAASLATTTTDANGIYLFDGLLAGDYRVKVTEGVPTGLAQSVGMTVPTSVITLSASNSYSYLDADFGYVPSAGKAVIGDRIWSDVDGDGVQDTGETGIGGVTVQLKNAGGTVIATTTTDTDGSYLFTNVVPGTYTVFLPTPPSGYTPTYDFDGTGSANQATLSVLADTTYLAVDFGYQSTSSASGSIGDTVYNDNNGNGVQDGGELGIDGVTVNLLSFGVLSGMLDINGDNTITSADDAASFDVGKTVVDGVIYSGLNPYNGTLTINGVSYTVIAGKIDIKNNGVIDYKDNLFPQILATTTTAGGGLYDFTGLAPGDYRVEVTDTANVVDDMTATQVSGGTIAITCPGGSPPCTNYDNADFGYTNSTTGSGKIGDTLYFDSDGDGFKDTGEIGIGGVTVDLVSIGIINGYVDLNGDGLITAADAGKYGGYNVYAGGIDISGNGSVGLEDDGMVNGIKVIDGRLDVNGDNAVNDSDDQAPQVIGTKTTSDGTTDVDGNGSIDPLGTYWFTGIEAGVYRVVVTDTNNVLGGLTPTETEGVLDVTCSGSTCNYNGVSLTEYADADFGYKSTNGGTGTLGGTIWHDTVFGSATTEQGVLNTGEPRIQGVTVELWLDNNGNGIIEPGTDNLVRTTTTNNNGDYLFLGLPPANYIVNVVDSKKVVDGLLDMNGDGVVNVSDDGLYGGKVIIDGAVDWNGNGSIGNDDDGTLFGVPVIDGKLDVNLSDTITADDDGTAGDKVLGGMQPVTGPTPTADNNGHLDPFATTLTLGEVDTSVDFGYKASGTPVSLGGVVFEDAGTSLGTYNDPTGGGDDAYVPGATVYLYRVVNGVQYLIGTTTTGANGSYSFTDLPSGGTYVVKVDTTGSLAEGMQQTVDPDYSGIVCTTCDSQYTVTLTTTVTNVNFGYWNGGIVTTPVTLAYFKATADKQSGQIGFEWWTATETGNLGFELYVEVDGERVRINPQPVLGKVSSTEPVEYGYTADGFGGDVFWIADVDIDRKRTWHGPYRLGKAYGHKPKVDPIDWQKVKQEMSGKKTGRDKQALRDASSAVQLAVTAGTSVSAVDLVVMRDPPDASYARVTYSSSARVYRVTYEDLLAAGMSLENVKLDRLAVYKQGQPWPITVVGAGTGKNASLFGPGSYIEFVGEGADSLYTAANPYRLVVGTTAGLRVAQDSRKPAKNFVPAPYYMERVSREREWDYAIESPIADPWFDDYLVAWGGPSAVLARDISIDQYLPGAAPAQLEVGLWGVTSLSSEVDHHVLVGFNGVNSVADHYFDGRSDGTVTATLPDNLLVEGNNSLSLYLPFDLDYGLDEYGEPGYDMIALNRYSVTYPRRFVARDGRLSFTAAGQAFTVQALTSGNVVVYRVDETGVTRINGVQVAGSGQNYTASFPGTTTPATYHVASVSALGAPGIEPVVTAVDCAAGTAANYLVISHEDFIGADLQRLLDARAAEGYSVAVVPTGGLYSHYSHGRFDPSAIAACIRDAVEHRDTQAVLLVGADNYDYLDYFELGTVSFLPSFYAQTGGIVSWAPVDGLFGDVDGDRVPDVAVGRFPVRNSADLKNMVDRTLQYRTKSYAKTAVFAADKYDTAQQHDFRADSEAILAELPAGWSAQTAYMDDLGLAGARSALLGAINGGVALTAFIGHSGPTDWTFDGLFTSTDATSLTNAGKPTVVTQWGCWNTFYVSPWVNSLGHSFLLSGDRGAAAVLGASTLTEAEHETEFGKRLFGVGGLANSGITIGEAMLRAKQDLALDNPEWIDVILGWQLLGDPLLQVSP